MTSSETPKVDFTEVTVETLYPHMKFFPTRRRPIVRRGPNKANPGRRGVGGSQIGYAWVRLKYRTADGGIVTDGLMTRQLDMTSFVPVVNFLAEVVDVINQRIQAKELNGKTIVAYTVE